MNTWTYYAGKVRFISAFSTQANRWVSYRQDPNKKITCRTFHDSEADAIQGAQKLMASYKRSQLPKTVYLFGSFF
jgi:hypothetical protein